jgi:hypothetical protein
MQRALPPDGFNGIKVDGHKFSELFQLRPLQVCETTIGSF